MKNRGFSLVEMSVVIAIIAVLLTLALKTKNLLTASEVKKIMALVEEYKVANQVFYQKYSNIPGDMSDATTKIDSATTNGDGDGEANVGGDTQEEQELIYAWTHLFKAGLTAFENSDALNTANSTFGSTIQNDAASGSCTKPVSSVSNNVPSLGVRKGGIEYKTIYGDVTGTANDYKIHFVIGKGTYCEAVMKDGIFSPQELKEIDIKYDDGAATTGNVMGVANGTSNCIDGSNLYNTSNELDVCSLEYIFNTSSEL